MAPLPLHAARGALPRAVRPAARARGACGTKVWVPLVTSQVAARGGQARKASGRPVADFKVGDAVTGTVTQIYCPGGVSVDVGCETLAFLEVEEFSDGFPAEGPFRFRPGDTVHARVLDVNPDARVEDHGEPDPFGEHGDTGKLHLTLRSGPLERPTRFVADASRPANLDAFSDISMEAWLVGEVVMMSNWAVYVKVQRGEESFVGILELEEFSKDFAQVAIRGCEVQVRIKEVDLESRRLLLTMRHMDADSASEQRRAPAVNMEKPDHSADVLDSQTSKQRKPKTMLGGIQPWAVGAGAQGCWAQQSNYYFILTVPFTGTKVMTSVGRVDVDGDLDGRAAAGPLGPERVERGAPFRAASTSSKALQAVEWSSFVQAFQKVVEEVPEEFEKLIERRRAALDRKAEKNLLTIPMEPLGMDTPPEMRQSTACDFSRRPSAESGCRVIGMTPGPVPRKVPLSFGLLEGPKAARPRPEWGIIRTQAKNLGPKGWVSHFAGCYL
ncbi:Uncharacterized protein SCF082_LOCUS26779 [Durusdinium trenchii]|uniref:S1 motif domain-containing protein n=1 Tax=Durusdinium trenchii TaxID=1381693 RepID=A0ABP0M8W2_9DINO